MMVRLLIETIPVIENDNDREEGLRGTNNEQMISSEHKLAQFKVAQKQNCTVLLRC